MKKHINIILLATILFFSLFFASQKQIHAASSPVCGDSGIDTAIGCIPVGNSKDFTVHIIGWLAGIAGGVALVLIVYAGFLVMTSSGDPRKAQAGKELLTAAVSGLVMLVGAAFILEFIGVDLLGILK